MGVPTALFQPVAVSMGSYTARTPGREEVLVGGAGDEGTS